MLVRWLVRSSAFLAPLVLLFAFVWQAGVLQGDYAFHSTYRGDSAYPPALAWSLNALEHVAPRGLALFLLAVLFVLYLPFVLVFELTREEKASWLYLYGSGVPLVLFFVWFVPQAIIHVFILATLRWKYFAFVFLAVGWLIHGAWLPALILAVGYRSIRWEAC